MYIVSLVYNNNIAPYLGCENTLTHNFWTWLYKESRRECLNWLYKKPNATVLQTVSSVYQGMPW